MVSKVSSVQSAETFTDHFGQKWSFIYTMEDGQVLKANHKKEACPFCTGDEVEYEIKGLHDGMARGTVKRPQPKEGAQPSSPEPSYSNRRDDPTIGNQWAINAAINLLQFQVTSGSQMSMSEIERVAKELINVRTNLLNIQ